MIIFFASFQKIFLKMLNGSIKSALLNPWCAKDSPEKNIYSAIPCLSNTLWFFRVFLYVIFFYWFFSKLHEELGNSREEISILHSERERYQETMKKAFMRGVCALNVEAMNMFQGSEEEHTGGWLLLMDHYQWYIGGSWYFYMYFITFPLQILNFKYYLYARLKTRCTMVGLSVRLWSLVSATSKKPQSGITWA